MADKKWLTVREQEFREQIRKLPPMSQAALARHLNIPRQRVHQLIVRLKMKGCWPQGKPVAAEGKRK